MNLNEYPKAIADLRLELVKSSRKIQTLKESVAFCLNAIDRAIAFNSDLKNDSQRKAKRAELMETDGDYITAVTQLKAAEDVHAELEIELELLRNTFFVLKLDRREDIARQEAAIAA